MLYLRHVPVVVAPLLGFSLGAWFAWAAREDLARAAGRVESRSLVVAALFSALVFAPAAGYLAASFPDWSYAYVLDAAARPLALDSTLVLIDVASVPAGFVTLRRRAASRNATALAPGALVPSILALGVVLATLPRLRVFATYAQFHGDFGTEPVTGSPLGWALIWTLGVVAFATLWTTHVLGRFADAHDTN
jgi:hypothetical protein